MLPEPPRHHRLEAATARFVHQLQRTQAYLAAVQPVIATQSEADQNLQYCSQTIVLMLHTFMEEHFRLLVSLATVYQAAEVRRYLASRRPGVDEIEEMPAARLMREVRREVSFHEQSRKLKSIFQLLFGIPPFADPDAETKCRDLISVRNIITHQGGLLEEADVPQMSSPDVVVRTDAAGPLVFHQLHIRPVFFAEVLVALGRSVGAIDKHLKQDPRYAY